MDAVQYAPHLPIDVKAIDADVLVFSAYKLCGPHLGIAYGRRELLEAWRPYKARPAGTSGAGSRFETGSLPSELLGGFIATYGLPRTTDRVPIFLLNLPNVAASTLAADLAAQDFGVWSGGNFYALGLYERLNWGEALRVGISHYNTLAEVDQLTAALRRRAGVSSAPASGRTAKRLQPGAV